jgi:ABC-type amino acid transport substrate-binding protein
VVAALRATPKYVVGGEVMVPNGSDTEIQLLDDIRNYVLVVQQEGGE